MLTTLYKLGPWDDKVKSELQPFYDLKTKQAQVYVDVKLANYTSHSQSLPRHSSPTRGIKVGAYIAKGKFDANLRDFLVAQITSSGEDQKQCSMRRFGGKFRLRELYPINKTYP